MEETEILERCLKCPEYYGDRKRIESLPMTQFCFRYFSYHTLDDISKCPLLLTEEERIETKGW